MCRMSRSSRMGVRPAHAAVIALVVVCAIGAAPPPPSPPPAPYSDTSAPVAIVTTAEGDTIAIESDRLQPSPLSFFGQIEGPEQAMKLVLDSGDTLTLNDETPAGSYRLMDRRVLRVRDGTGYPRSFDWVSAERVLPFRISSSARVGVLVPGPDGSTQSLASVGRQFVEALGRSSRPRVTGASRTTAYLYPPDWYPRAQVEVGPECERPFVVVWIAFGERSGDPEQVQRRAGAMVLRPRDAPARRAAPTLEDVLATGRIIGSALIDPVSGAVVPGAGRKQ